MTEMFGEAWSPMSVPDLAPDDDDICKCRTRSSMIYCCDLTQCLISIPTHLSLEMMSCDEFFKFENP